MELSEKICLWCDENGFDEPHIPEELEDASKKDHENILFAIEQEYADIRLTIRRKPYILEISTVDMEKDIILSTEGEYLIKYGSDALDKFEN